jgi:phosphoserine phosphatase
MSHVATIIGEMSIPIIDQIKEIFSVTDLKILSYNNHQVRAVEIYFSGDTVDLIPQIKSICLSNHLDFAIQQKQVYETEKKLIVFDLDSTLIQQEVIDELARSFNVYEEVSKM